jgi:hypothetical protein
VARRSRNGSVALCYVFAPSPERAGQPSPALGPHDAVLIVRVDGFAIRDGFWPTMGTTPGWNPGEWPVPLFARVHLDGQAWLVGYSDDDLETASSVIETSIESARQYAPDSFLPRAIVEATLSALIPSDGCDVEFAPNGPLWRVSLTSGRVLATDARIGAPRSFAELDHLASTIAAESNGTAERVLG